MDFESKNPLRWKVTCKNFKDLEKNLPLQVNELLLEAFYNP